MRLALAFALVLAACGGAAAPARPVAASASAPPSAAATPIPTQNIFQLMGGAPATTIFALAGGRVRAVRLLDHFVKYEIAVEGGAQLLASSDGLSLVVVDQPGPGVRLRAFEVASGKELASSRDDDVPAMLVAGPGRGALAADASGRILVLKADGRTAWIDAYDGASLRLVQRRLVEALPSGRGPACAERLVLAGPRVALVCLRDGSATVATLGGGAAVPARLASGEIAGAAASSFGDSILAVTPAGEVYRWQPAAAEAALYGKAAGEGPVPRDGLAVVEDQVVVARGGSAPSVQIVTLYGASRPLPVPAAPAAGLLASSPFAYFTRAGTLYHVDLNTGNVERMTGGFEDDAAPAAIVAR